MEKPLRPFCLPLFRVLLTPRSVRLSSGEHVENIYDVESAFTKGEPNFGSHKAGLLGGTRLLNGNQYESAMLSLALLMSKKRSVFVIVAGSVSPLA